MPSDNNVALYLVIIRKIFSEVAVNKRTNRIKFFSIKSFDNLGECSFLGK